jgi:Ni,Fe-hydrogenase I large subunit
MEFIARPKWQGQCHETSALARQAGQPLLQAVMERHGAGLLARALARLLDLCCLLQPASQEGIDHGQLPEGIGIGQVESARGRLLHWLQYQDGLVLDYQVLAPTEWNCHPEGALAQGLINLGEAEAEILHHRAGMLIEAIDPCIGWHF